jgi:thymidylate synthase (FAD)
MVPEPGNRTPVLDHGYVEQIETWGSDETIIEAARMSTDKGFQGWGPKPCPHLVIQKNLDLESPELVWCRQCAGTGVVAGDEKLLAYLYKNKHMTPFEMAGMTIEVQAPILVFREWHRHRVPFGYNEMSARYVPLPNVNYHPSRARIIEGAKASGNKQAAGTTPLAVEAIDDWLKALDAAYDGIEQTYQTGLAIGIPKEIARVVLPVGRYSRMRATGNLRGWLAFLTLRMDEHAQWEIRQYANVVGELIKQAFPRTWELFAVDYVNQKAAKR